MDFIYRRYRQETQSALKEQPVEEKKPLSHYEAAEQKRKENNQPEEKMFLQNSYGTVNLGRFRGEQAVLVVSGISEQEQKKPERQIFYVRQGQRSFAVSREEPLRTIRTL